MGQFGFQKKEKDLVSQQHMCQNSPADTSYTWVQVWADAHLGLASSYLESLPHQKTHSAMDLKYKEDVKYPDVWSADWETKPKHCIGHSVSTGQRW